MTNTDYAQYAALGARPVAVPVSEWERRHEAARAILDPVLRARALDALLAEVLAPWAALLREGARDAL